MCLLIREEVLWKCNTDLRLLPYFPGSAHQFSVGPCLGFPNKNGLTRLTMYCGTWSQEPKRLLISHLGHFLSPHVHHQSGCNIKICFLNIQEFCSMFPRNTMQKVMIQWNLVEICIVRVYCTFYKWTLMANINNCLFKAREPKEATVKI